MLDVFQSAGVLPLALRDWGVDAAVGGCLKWLCGGPGNCFLYVDPDRAATLEPAITGWVAHAAPFAFEPPPIRWRSGAGRFTNGTPQVPALYAARAGLDVLAEIGIERVREKSVRMTERLFAEAIRRGYACSCAEDPERRGGTVAVEVPDGERVARELLHRDIVIDYRPGFGIRIAPHFYNTWEECLRCARHHRRHPGRPLLPAPLERRGRQPDLSGRRVALLLGGRDVVVHPEKVGRVVARLDAPQSIVVLAVVHRRALLVFGAHEVHVPASFRVRPQRVVVAPAPNGCPARCRRDHARRRR